MPLCTRQVSVYRGDGGPSFLLVDAAVPLGIPDVPQEGPQRIGDGFVCQRDGQSAALLGQRPRFVAVGEGVLFLGHALSVPGIQVAVKVYAGTVEMNPATRRALAQVRPGADGVLFIDRARHPHLYRYAVEARRVSVSSALWKRAYLRYGDEMEQTLHGVVTQGQEYRTVTKALLEALPDPWMVVGTTAEELGPDFFVLWELLYTRDLPQALVLTGAKVPARARELAAWADCRLSVPAYPRASLPQFSRHVTWENTFGRSLRFGRDEEAEASDPFMYAVTEADLYEFMDAGVRPSPDEHAGSLQEQRARLRGTWSRERSALAQLAVSYGPDVDEKYPAASRFMQKAYEDTTVEVDVGSADLSVFDPVLQGTESFNLDSLRERLAYEVPDVRELHGGALSGAEQRMWESVVEYAEEPQEWFAPILGTEASVEEVELVISWMGKYRRPHLPWFSERSWADFVLRRTDSEFFSPPSGRVVGVAGLCQLIRAGAGFEQVTGMFWEDGLSVDEMVEVLVHGMPVEYVLAMRPPVPEPPF